MQCDVIGGLILVRGVNQKLEIHRNQASLKSHKTQFISWCLQQHIHERPSERNSSKDLILMWFPIRYNGKKKKVTLSFSQLLSLLECFEFSL